MNPPFKVVSSKPQKTTGTDAWKTYRPSTTGQRIAFVGSLTDGAKFQTEAFTALAGEGAPTPSGGYARWNIIGRPQRVGMTVLDGYDPLQVDVPILFDAVVNDHDIETDIQKLEWMAGRGILYTSSGVGKPGQGDSPLVTVFSADSRGVPNSLFPAQYQTSGLRWVITGLAWDTNPLKNGDGDRTRQAVTVTLTEHVSGPGTSYDSAATRAKGRQSVAGQYKSFPVTAAHNTIRKITTFDAHNPAHAAAVAVLNANRSNAKLRLSSSVDQDLAKHLPLGTKIKVPLSVILA
jgi:hypothetical protein